MTYDQWFRSQQGISYEGSYLFAEAAWDHQQKRINELEAELTRVKHNLAVTEQTMREYQELAAKRLEEIAKYRDAPVVAYWYKYHNCFGDEVCATDSNWGGCTPL